MSGSIKFEFIHNELRFGHRIYRLKRNYCFSKYYMCKTVPKCYASISIKCTDFEKPEMERATFNDKHTDECHDLEETDFEIFDFIANVKEIITNKPHMPLQKLYEMKRAEAKEYSDTIFPDYPDLASQFKSHRKKINKCQPNALTLSDVIIEHTLTSYNKRFLLFDNQKKNRIIIFCSDVGLQMLSESSIFHSDGTFHTKSKYF